MGVGGSKDYSQGGAKLVDKKRGLLDRAVKVRDSSVEGQKNK